MGTGCWLRYYNEGIGKPETLTVNLTGFRNRRINDKDRLIYKIDEENVYILACSNHYADKDSAILKQEMNLPGLLQWKANGCILYLPAATALASILSSPL